ncbi:Low-density lipoprotein receptor domain class A [Paragonimus heterotremus]|uniref:Low-density lipoprotein receptor domain class A n=1 Tax=Paragonimus heterotremus TaxID=100268 RepID=A0A8J4WFX8_9TREM|nr:Low-density lipoprotein receptor domain class A [Paragonimus heterotremus]
MRLQTCVLLFVLIFTVRSDEYEEDISVGGYHPDEVRPTIFLTPGSPGQLEWSEGDDLYSRCSVQNGEQYYIKWIRRLPDRTVQELSQNALLFLPKVRASELQHPIYCQVTRDSDGAVFEELLNVRVAEYQDYTGSTELQLTIRSLPAEDLSQGRVMRQCLFEGDPALNDQFDFRWLDQSGRVVNNGDALILLLENLVDLGNYTCEATNRQTGTIYQARYHVTRASRSQDMQYAVEIRPVTPELHVGRPYEMVCEVRPPPERPVRFTWFHNDQVVSNDARLVLSSLAYPDIGSYICRAEWTPDTTRTGSMAANATVELTLALTRTTEIEMSPPPGSILVTLPGEMRELHCEFASRGPPDVRWFFDGQPLEFHPTLNASGTVHRMDALRVSIVTLRSVDVSQGGTYECRIGSEIKQTHVIVRSEKGLEVNPETETVDEGMAVEFHCRAHGANQMVNREMEWFFRPFHGGSMVPLSLGALGGFVRQDDDYASHTSFVSKARARKQDEGEYICRLPSQNLQAVGRLYVRSISVYNVVITPSIIRVRINQPIELECYVTEEGWRPAPVMPRFRLRDSRIHYDTQPVGENRARFSIPGGLDSDFNGTQVECYTDQPGNVATATIIVESTCPQGYRRCRSGQCLPAGRFCDGVPDCADRSDEDPLFCNACDPISKQCEYYQNRAPIKKTYMIHWECDGEDDCGNGFDEVKCPDPNVARCDGTMFNCGSGNRRIPLAYVCDKDQDCPYGEDERNCAVPTIQTSEIYRYPVRQGGQVVLTCRVFGLPVPRVIWRFNWGCLPDEGGRFRVTSTVQNCDSPTPVVLSTLTIQNVRPGDDGIYNCEALAGAHRAMSNDYFVMLES